MSHCLCTNYMHLHFGSLFLFVLPPFLSLSTFISFLFPCYFSCINLPFRSPHIHQYSPRPTSLRARRMLNPDFTYSSQCPSVSKQSINMCSFSLSIPPRANFPLRSLFYLPSILHLALSVVMTNTATGMLTH